MSKRNSKSRAKSAQTDAQVDAAPVADQAAPAETNADVAARVAKTVNRLPFQQAKDHNVAIAPVDPAAPVPAGIVLTAKGTNTAKRRVYGYDNGSGGLGVPKSATVVVVPFNGTPKAVKQEQWELLLSLVQRGVSKVADLYDNKVSDRTVRRAFRAGAIRFQQVTAS